MRRGLAVVAAYLALVLVLTWPLARHLGTHLPRTNLACQFDLLYVAWVLAWQSHALLTGGFHLRDANIFHPARGTLFFGPTAPGALPFVVPIQALTGNPTLATNVLFLGGIVASAAAVHLVAVRWTRSHLAGLVAAATLLTTRWFFWDLAAFPHWALVFYLPLIILMASTPAPTLGRALWLVPLIVLQSLADPVYRAAAVMVPLGLLAAARVLRPSTRAAGARLVAALGLSLLALLPIYAAYARVLRENPALGSTWSRPGLPATVPWGPFRQGALAVPGVLWIVIVCGPVVIARGGLEATERRGWLHAALWMLVGLYISLTPTLHWTVTPWVPLSGTMVQLPGSALARWLGVYQIVRAPQRLGVASLMGVALLAGLAFAECARRLPARRHAAWHGVAALLVTAAMYRSYATQGRPRAPGWPGSYPIGEAIRGDSPIVRALAAGQGPVLELPIVDPDGSMAVQARAMYRSIYHWRPLVNGYSSYWPPGFRERMVLAARLPDADALARLRAETGVDAIVVDLAAFRAADAPRRQAWLAAARGDVPDLRLVVRDGQELLFDVAGAAPGQAP